MGRLEGKVAIVTGSSTGIGAQIARVFASEGAKVVVCCNNDTINGQAVADEIVQAGGTAVFHQVDVREENQVKALYQKTEAQFGRIDILVNNAGVVGKVENPDEITMEDYDFVMDIDARGTFICAKNIIEYFRRIGGGNIVNITSICALKAEVGGLAPYHIAKAAAQMITKVFAMSYAKENIRCNSVNPGTTLTPLIENMAKENYGSLENYAAMVGPSHPMGNGDKQKLGETIDVAMAAVYLASDEAKWVTGAQISVDGGWSVT
jgi:NAD(P)-dependent dehydrogenase (short-subunit alcohol dehydrogenase family)